MVGLERADDLRRATEDAYNAATNVLVMKSIEALRVARLAGHSSVNIRGFELIARDIQKLRALGYEVATDTYGRAHRLELPDVVK